MKNTRAATRRKTTSVRPTVFVVCAFALTVTAVVWIASGPASKADADVIVYKTATCSCCAKWVDHLRDRGLSVAVQNVRDTQNVRLRVGVPDQLRSCHTATVGSYWVEGHVPADIVNRLVTEKPEGIAGIAVPGMPIGSPGMEGPNAVIYDVFAYGVDGRTTRYASRPGKESSP